MPIIVEVIEHSHSEHMSSPPMFCRAGVAQSFSFLCIALLITVCPFSFGHRTGYLSSVYHFCLPRLVSSNFSYHLNDYSGKIQLRACLINVICVCLPIVMSNLYCVVFLFCFSSSCGTHVASFYELSFLITPSVFSNVYFAN